MGIAAWFQSHTQASPWPSQQAPVLASPLAVCIMQAPALASPLPYSRPWLPPCPLPYALPWLPPCPMPYALPWLPPSPALPCPCPHHRGVLVHQLVQEGADHAALATPRQHQGSEQHSRAGLSTAQDRMGVVGCQQGAVVHVLYTSAVHMQCCSAPHQGA